MAAFGLISSLERLNSAVLFCTKILLLLYLLPRKRVSESYKRNGKCSSAIRSINVVGEDF